LFYKEGLNFKLLADTDYKVTTAYGSLTSIGVAKFAARHTFIINPDGKIVKVYEDVNPNKHSKEVLSALTDRQKQKAPEGRLIVSRRLTPGGG
jgi:peroxiredoxin Q/BCP